MSIRKSIQSVECPSKTRHITHTRVTIQTVTGFVVPLCRCMQGDYNPSCTSC